MTTADTVTATQGETLDEICMRHYGKTRGVTEQVLDYNPGLASKGERLPAGQKVLLPAIKTAAKSNTITLWE